MSFQCLVRTLEPNTQQGGPGPSVTGPATGGSACTGGPGGPGLPRSMCHRDVPCHTNNQLHSGPTPRHRPATAAGTIAVSTPMYRLAPAQRPHQARRLPDPVSSHSWRVPALRSWVALANYYRRFIPSFADIVKPLHVLLLTGAKWTWGDEQRRAVMTTSCPHQRRHTGPVPPPDPPV